MKKQITCVVFFSLLLASCQKNETSTEYSFEAEVLGRNPSCGIYAIKILNGLPQVKAILGTTYEDSTYIAKNLPTELETVGLNIMLNIRKIQDDELGPCLTFGETYPWLFVKTARKK